MHWCVRRKRDNTLHKFEINSWLTTYSTSISSHAISTVSSHHSVVTVLKLDERRQIVWAKSCPHQHQNRNTHFKPSYSTYTTHSITTTSIPSNPRRRTTISTIIRSHRKRPIITPYIRTRKYRSRRYIAGGYVTTKSEASSSLVSEWKQMNNIQLEQVVFRCVIDAEARNHKLH